MISMLFENILGFCMELVKSRKHSSCKLSNWFGWWHCKCFKYITCYTGVLTLEWLIDWSLIVTQISSSAVTKECATHTMHSTGTPFGCTCPVTAAATFDQFHQWTRCNGCISWHDLGQQHLAPFSNLPPMFGCYKMLRIWGQAGFHHCRCQVCTGNVCSKCHFRGRQGT